MGADYIMIAIQTNYFDASRVEAIINDVLVVNVDALIIKFTIFVGSTKRTERKLGIKSLLFSPKLLRESKTLYDNLYPSRTIVGEQTSSA